MARDADAEWLVLDAPLDPANPTIGPPQLQVVRSGEVFRVPLFPYLLPDQVDQAIWYALALGAHLANAVPAGPHRSIKHLHIVRSATAPAENGRVRIQLGLAIQTR